MSKANGAKKPKVGHVQLSKKRLDNIYPSPENQKLYRPVDPDDPEIIELAKSIRKYGVREPLVITLDSYILSGHRRHTAARLAGKTFVPVRVEPIRRTDNVDRFVVLLREHNRQRDKTLSEKFREEIVTADPNEAYQSLIDHRQQEASVQVETMTMRSVKKRASISKAKQPFLDAITHILFDLQRDFWPLTVRRIHYALLNAPPLLHASKPESVYVNDRKSYQACSELTTRARLVGLIPMEAIDDATRPIASWNVHTDPREFLRQQLNGFCKGYWRDLLSSQPNHIEIVCEKSTCDPIIRPVASEFCICVTTGRGYCSLPPRHKMAERFRKSGKENLVLLALSDFDPDGEVISESFARSMRDDFEIDNIVPVRVALTADHVQEFDLPPLMKAKKSSVHHAAFTKEHGEHVHELEALQPRDLQNVLRKVIDSVIDVEAFNAELNTEREDAAFLHGIRHSVQTVFAELEL